LTDPSRHLKRFFKDRKGYSGIIATIFMVLVLLFLFFDVFMFTAQRNADLQDTVSLSQQMEADSKNEELMISDAEISANAGQVSIDCKISNMGTLPSQLVRLWVQINVTSEAVSEIQNPTITIQPGETVTFSDILAVSGASPSTQNNFWFATARGNIVSATDSILFQQEIAKKIGSILLDWGDFRYYDLLSYGGTTDIQLPDPIFDFTLPQKHAVLLGVQIRNLDPDGRQITLTGNSFACLQGVKVDPKTGIISKLDPQYYKIATVTSDTFRPNTVFADLTLDINVPTVIYFFVPKDKTKDFYSADLTIVLQGYTATSDFSQTVPFGALEFSSSMPQLFFQTGSGQTLIAGQLSGPITIGRRYNNPDPPIVPITTGDLTVALSGAAGGKFYKDSAGTIPITSIVINDGESSAIFYYKDLKVEKPILKASAGGYVAASTKFTITAGTMSRLVFIKGASQTLNVNQTSANIKVRIQNEYGVPFKTTTSRIVSLSTTSAGGTFQHGFSITISSGQSDSPDFWYKDSVHGTPTLTASYGSLTPATTTFTIR